MQHRNTILCILCILWTLLQCTATARAREPGESPSLSSPGSHLPTRTPLPIADDDAGDEVQRSEPLWPRVWGAIRGAAGQMPGVIRSWQRGLSRHMPAVLAWAVLAAPLPLLLLLALVLRRRRVRATSKQAIAPKPLPSSDTSRGEAKDLAELKPPNLSASERLLLQPDSQGLALHETMVLMGPDEGSLARLRWALTESLSHSAWQAAVESCDGAPLTDVRQRWIKGLAADRVARWLEADPRVTERNLRASMPDLHLASELESVALTRPDGLGVGLSDEQETLLHQARQTLARIWADPRPQVWLAVLGDAEPGPLLPQGRGLPIAQAALLHGARGLTNGRGQETADQFMGQEFLQSLAEHARVVQAPIAAEGCAVHALLHLTGRVLPGIGTVAAAAAGAAYSPMAVTVRVSKMIADLTPPQQQACERLGELARAALADRSTGDGAQLVTNIRAMLGLPLAEQSEQMAQRLLAAAKQLSRHPCWAESTTEAPQLMLARLHHRLLEHSQLQCRHAEHRLLDVLDQLAFEGKKGDNRRLARRRLGYVVAGLGPSLLRNTGAELVTSGRDTLAALEQ